MKFKIICVENAPYALHTIPDFVVEITANYLIDAKSQFINEYGYSFKMGLCGSIISFNQIDS